MKKSKAISALQNQKQKIFKQGFIPDVWIDDTLNYIVQIFGKESDQYIQINDLDFIEAYPKTGYQIEIHLNETKIPNERDIAASKIDSMIDQLKTLGMPKKNNNQVNKPYINYVFWGSILFALIGGAFTLGYHFGNSKFDKEKEEFYSGQIIWKKKHDRIKTQYDSIIQQEIDESNNDTISN